MCLYVAKYFPWKIAQKRTKIVYFDGQAVCTTAIWFTVYLVLLYTRKTFKPTLFVNLKGNTHISIQMWLFNDTASEVSKLKPCL